MKNPRHIVIVGASSDLAGAVAPLLATGGRLVTPVSRASLGAEDYAKTDWTAIFENFSRRQPVDAILHIPGHGAFGQASAVSESEARQALEVNFWLVTKVALAANAFWASTRGPGTFFAVLSLAALRAIPGEAWYCAGKAAAARWLETMDLENRRQNRRFFSLYPGKFQSKFRRDAGLQEADAGAPLASVAQSVASAVLAGGPGRVIGWREKTITLADRWWPGLYDNLILKHRV